MPKRTSAYAPWLAERLKDPRVASDYVRASAGSPEELLKALRKIAEAHQVSKVAEAAGRQRESVYRMLSEDGNPRLDSLWGVLHAMGLRIDIVPISEYQTGGNTAPNNTEVLQQAEKLLVESNLVSSGRDSSDSLLSFGMITVPAQARKGPGIVLENFAFVGQSAIGEQTGALIGRY